MEGGGRRCAACKFLRRKCSDECVLAPYFESCNPYRFYCVHKIFGASNAARIIRNLPVGERGRAADAMAWEAYWRVQDPVYGCNTIIAQLQHEIHKAQNELELTRAQIAIHQELRHQQPDEHSLGHLEAPDFFFFGETAL